MSYSRMVLEQIKYESQLELYEEYRAQRPGYQNILDDAISLAEQNITTRQAAIDYPFMIRSERPDNLLPAPVPSPRYKQQGGTGSGAPGTFYPDTPATLASKAASNELRSLAKGETTLSQLMGTETDRLSDKEKELASQTMSQLRSELEGAEDMPNLTPGDLVDIAKRQSQRTAAASQDLNARLAQQSDDPNIASLGGLSLTADLDQRATELSNRRRELVLKNKAGTLTKDEIKKFQSDYDSIVGDYETRGARAATSALKPRESNIQTFFATPEQQVGQVPQNAPYAELAGRAATFSPISRIRGIKAAENEATNLAREQLANIITSNRDLDLEAQRDRLASQFKVDPITAERESRAAGISQIKGLAQDIKDTAAGRARLSDPNRMAAGARALGRAGLLPGVGRLGGRGK